MKMLLLLAVMVLSFSVLIIPDKAYALITNTYQVIQSSDDCIKYSTTSFNLTFGEIRTGTYLTIPYNDNGIRFQNITMPTFAYQLYGAYLILRGLGYSGTQSSRIYYEDIGDSPTFTDLTDFNARTRSTSYYTFSGTTGAGSNVRIFITGLLTNLFTRADWYNGNSLSLFFTTYGYTGYKRAYSYDGSVTYAPKLEIQWLQNYYIHFYTNNEYSYTVDFYNGLPYSNNTDYPISELTTSELITALNGSYVFKNYTFVGYANITDNPYEIPIPLNYGNKTVWAYSEVYEGATTEEINTLTVFAIIGLCIGVIAIAVFIKKVK